jgi:hypothetical protein
MSDREAQRAAAKAARKSAAEAAHKVAVEKYGDEDDDGCRLTEAAGTSSCSATRTAASTRD